MYGCIQGSLYSMTAEILHQITEQEGSTNAIVRRWAMLKVIPCTIMHINETGSSSSSDNKSFSKEYVEELEIRMYSSERLSKRWRVSSIRNSKSQNVYVEVDRVSSPDTIFEVYASHPVLDIFGNTQYYESNLRRVTVQSND